MLARSRSGHSGIVTPEAVVLEFETAGMASRLLATALDLTIQVLLFLAVLLAFFGANTVGLDLGGGAAALLYIGVFVLLFGYPAGFEAFWRGRTPGKAALGLRVVTVEGAPIRFRHAATRAILGLVDKFLFSGIVGVVCLLVSNRNQRLGDLVAGTLVLRERSGAKAPTSVTFSPPPGLEGYVASLDAGGLGHEDYAAVRAFLIRAGGLAGPARAGLAERLATPLAARLRTAPPPGMPAEVFLACVAAAYQRRTEVTRPSSTPFRSVWADDAPVAAPSSAAAQSPEAATAPAADGAGFTAPG